MHSIRIRPSAVAYACVLTLGILLGYLIRMSASPEEKSSIASAPTPLNSTGLAQENEASPKVSHSENSGMEGVESAARTVEIAFGSDNEKMISLPERSLDYFLFRCFSDNTGLLERTLARDMGISEEQAIRVDAIATDAFNSMAVIEQQTAELKTDADGGEYYSIPPFKIDDVERIEAAMYSSLKLEVGEGLAKLITHSAKTRGKFFSAFGDGGQEISILEEPGFGGATHYKLAYKYFDRDGNLRGSGSSLIEDVDKVRDRYGHLFRKNDEP